MKRTERTKVGGIFRRFSIAAYVVILANVAVAAQPDTKSLIDGYERFVRQVEKLEYEIEQQAFARGGRHPTEVQTGEQRGLVRRQGVKWKIIAKSWLGPSDKRRGAFMIDFVCDRRGYVYAQGNHETEPLGEKGFGLSASFKAENTVPPWAYAGDVSVVYGEMHGGEPKFLPDFFRAATVESREDVVDNKTCWLLSCQTPEGQFRLWLNPDAGHSPIRFESVRGPSDLVGGKPVSEQKTLGGEYAPEQFLSGMSNVVKDIGIEQIGDTYFISGYETSDEYSYPNGETATSRSVVKLTNLKYDQRYQNSDFKITASVEDGTPVTVGETPQIDYEWRDGKVVKVVNDSVVKSLEGHEYQGLFGWGISPWTVAFCGLKEPRNNNLPDWH